MAQPLEIKLTAAEKEELEQIRDLHEKPYMRERATAILKIAEGQSGLQVAQNGLLKQRDPDTVYSWVKRYQAEGVAGLKIRAGRGRKPAFSPSTRQPRGGQTGPAARCSPPAPLAGLSAQPLELEPDPAAV